MSIKCDMINANSFNGTYIIVHALEKETEVRER